MNKMLPRQQCIRKPLLHFTSKTRLYINTRQKYKTYIHDIYRKNGFKVRGFQLDKECTPGSVTLYFYNAYHAGFVS